MMKLRAILKHHGALQPIWLTENDERPNDAQLLFLTDNATNGKGGVGLEEFERCAVLFDGNDEAAVAAARGQWSSLKESGHDLTYRQQTDEGRWEKRD